MVRVPADGNVTLVAVVVVKVRLFAPEVAKVDPFANVNVAEVAGAVIATLLTLVADATPSVGVVKLGDVANTNCPLPCGSLIIPISSDELVDANTLSLFPVVVSVPAVGKVTLEVAVVFKVREFAPTVASVDPFANVNVALVAGAVNVSLLYVVADTFPFANTTPDTEDEEPVEVYKLPPIPTPPVIFNAPVVVDVEVVASDTVKAELKVFAPAKVCVPVEITPLALEPASGRLNVWVFVADDIAKSVPDVPVAKL